VIDFHIEGNVPFLQSEVKGNNVIERIAAPSNLLDHERVTRRCPPRSEQELVVLDCRLATHKGDPHIGLRISDVEAENVAVEFHFGLKILDVDPDVAQVADTRHVRG
jgi:hypothetical protein